MHSNRTWLLALAIVSAVLYCGPSFAQAIISEDFTGTTTSNPWYYLNGACLTASTSDGTGAAGSVPGTPPGCTADGTYYKGTGDSVLVGGYYGTATGSVAFGPSSPALDPAGYGALRFTNGCINSSNTSCGSGSGGGHSQNGAIISANTYSTNQGLDITFKTVTYRGDSGGANGDGADGMSFFLMDGSTDLASDPTEDIGSYGGSLGYSCSNTNSNETEPYHGMVGAYLGLGIDEYGNFLNGGSNTLGESGSASTNGGLGDNTASGGLYQPNRIGLRGAGNIAWNWLTENYPSYYPATLSSSDQYTAVQDTCETGTLWNFSDADSPKNTGTTVMDYPAIPNAYTVISSKIANEYSSGGYSRQPYTAKATNAYGTGANPITYDLKITANGLLSLAYSYNGGAWTNVIKNQSITASNGPLPPSVRFGFAGSTGGSSNIHEILCFKAAPASQAASSTTVNQQQSSKIENGSQAYFGYYDPQNWTGALTANELVNTNGVLTIDATANWDASCVLTGATTCATTGQTGLTAQPWQTGSGGRVILTWSGSAGIPLEWNALTPSEQSALDAGDSSQTADRLQFLRGDQQEQIQNGGTFRNLDSTLGDIVDSSAAWVGPPSKSVYSAYETPMTWKDKLYPTASMPENSGQSYTSYVTAEAQRLNVVYVGANDGMLHGFSAGSYDSTGTVYNTSTNTGQEVLAYMPQGVLDTIHNALTPSIDYANPQYGHNFYVDATPGTGDLYYGNQWHTWLVGGLGPGGSEIYALDITNPANFSETNASSLVMGDWQGGTSATTNPGSFTCQNVADCALDLGDTYGTPTVRLLHNGDWALIFGNGLNSSTGDAGIYVLTIDPSATQPNGLPKETMYYLSTGETGKSDGIAYAHPVDMDGDHVVDYVYAGDTLGNVWRFNLTSSDPANWHAGSAPLFTTSSGQPITSDVYPTFVAGPAGTQLMLFFGTGRKFPITETSGTSYASGQQAFYGVWDWNMSAWNAYNSTQFASLPAGTAGTLGPSNLQQQTVTYDSGLPSIDTPYSVCWTGSTACNSATLAAKTSATSSNDQYGWYIDFPGTNSGYGTTTYEQEIYNPILVSTAIQFNSIVPAIDSPLMCAPDYDQGWSYALDVRDGNPIPGFFVNNGNKKTIALQTNASGSSSEVTTTDNSGNTDYYLIYQSTTGGAGKPMQIQPANNITGYRQTWVQLR
jgi:type IV pilus assembly protein PilY1